MFTETGFFLDIIVKDATMSNDIPDISAPLWVVFHVDGLSEPFSTQMATGGKRVAWNFAARIVLGKIDIKVAYLYATLCTYAAGNQSVVALARSRIGLRSLPTGSPRQFTFPLMREENGAQVFAHLCLQATLAIVARDVRSEGGPMPRRMCQEQGFRSTE